MVGDCGRDLETLKQEKARPTTPHQRFARSPGSAAEEPGASFREQLDALRLWDGSGSFPVACADVCFGCGHIMTF